MVFAPAGTPRSAGMPGDRPGSRDQSRADLGLALQAEWHGANAVEQVHDMVGNIVITSLVLAIWFLGKLLSPREAAPRLLSNEMKERAKRFLDHPLARSSSAFAAATIMLVAGIFAARLLYARAEGAVHMQTTPRFMAQLANGSANRLTPVPREVWNELHPTSGEYVRHNDPAGQDHSGDCFHFFWKPSVWNRFVLVHRPDICMPGIGWQPNGTAEPIDLDFEGQQVRFYVFRFERGSTYALELWGAWRNGDPVPLDYTTAQVFGAAPPPVSLQLEGKRHSATEIVACSITAEGAEPAREIAVALLRSVFNYKTDE